MTPPRPRPLRAIQQIQIGRVASTESQARDTLARLASAGFEAIELNGFMTRPTPLLVRALTRVAGMPVGGGGRLDWPRLVAESGLSVIALHEDLGTIERDPAAVVARAVEFGTHNVVVTGMHRFDYGDEVAVGQLAQRLTAAGRTLTAAGIRLLYHNHTAEFRRLPSGGTAFTMLVEQTDPDDVAFELDCFWAATAGADPLALLDHLGERVRLLHITDRGSRIAGSTMTPIVKVDSVELGTGNMAIEAIIDRAASLHVEAIILETHKNWIDGSPLRSAEMSAEVLRRLLP
ncbi:sugar phosphate isomerase/epimerase [Microbacterium sp. C7(2022)]|uniref:sugar phosphate isomerase/epimerase family protein n=1 Tax=Microbacterium sp. C7(2022) TaxID=2992759 RepID=UPI00237B06A7|nr:sugar phosphate isomerase/epimerase [Microbacterium sp. C7(2022)]MDE0545957.1 sugar phosphate isomerase/epimerase [Microbacterium sp. C7(2022)]